MAPRKQHQDRGGTVSRQLFRRQHDSKYGRRGGGVSILANKSYVASCTQVHLNNECDDDDISLEVMAASFCPYKLPLGFPDVIVFGVYLAEFERSRQSKGINRLKEAIENALVSGIRNSRPLTTDHPHQYIQVLRKRNVAQTLHI